MSSFRLLVFVITILSVANFEVRGSRALPKYAEDCDPANSPYFYEFKILDCKYLSSRCELHKNWLNHAELKLLPSKCSFAGYSKYKH